MKLISYTVVLTTLISSSLAHSGYREIEEISEPPIEKIVTLSQEEIAHNLASNTTDVVYFIKTRESEDSFQIYTEGNQVIVEIMFASYKLRDGEPYYFMEEISCPSPKGTTKIREWPINSSSNTIKAQFSSASHKARPICTAILDKNRSVLSWIHSFRFEEEKKSESIDHLLNEIAAKGMGLTQKPYFTYKEITIPQ